MKYQQRQVVAVVLLVTAAVAHLAASGPADSRAGGAPPVPAVAQQNQMHKVVHQLQQRLHELPQDKDSWARLGASYVELARVTADPAYYAKAEGALKNAGDTALAAVGMGTLANARHDFHAARDWGLKAVAAQPASAEAHGVLADALTQLGDDAGAQDAVQKMLDLKPNTASFARASFHFELHGDVDGAREAMQRALKASTTPEEIAFCRYRLGELAFDHNQLDVAAEHYEQGLAARGDDMTLTQGMAKVAAARGDVPVALDSYRRLVARAPLPQYLQEYAELLEAGGRGDEAAKQYGVLTEQQRLMESQGASDDLAAALLAADRGDGMQALRRAEAEWSRRQSVFVADAMAWALHVNGRDAEALSYSDRAVSLGWQNATFAYHRGMILAALGRVAEAQEALVRALTLNANFSPLQALKAGRKLAELRGGR
ncbi:tetratricopeptide repeat protein [Lentzea albida]|uniref:Tetratricopeptide repeat-containing protein n=1 Tax=Lentzea albida TaxID=65499 RepID=A0A1H9K7J3_9PSEU|nr:tetratricopeptide repeat protein [Lentzea albida]SEQ94897.1 Tetratricopeptide repeat-containing protein [Lentzea albida]